MKTLLAINASARRQRSITRRLTERFVTGWKTRYPDAEIIQRDVGLNAPKAIDEAWIAAAFSHAEQPSAENLQALAQSEAFIGELFRADAIVIGAPMYNFGMPAALKAYIDQIVRIGRTFTINPELENPYVPLVPAKPVIIIASAGAGGYEPGGPYAAMNFLEPHLEAVLRFIGFTDITSLHVGYEEFKDERWHNAIAQAEAKLDELLAHQPRG